MDIVDVETRSRMMGSVRQRDTGPEMLLRRALHREGLRFRVNDPRLPGRPDLVFPKFRAVVFVHGCYWHRHGCRYSTMPATRTAFWLSKFEANRARDARVLSELGEAGWRTLVVWECALKPARGDTVRRTSDTVKAWLEGEGRAAEIGPDGLSAAEPDRPHNAAPAPGGRGTRARAEQRSTGRPARQTDK